MFAEFAVYFKLMLRIFAIIFQKFFQVELSTLKFKEIVPQASWMFELIFKKCLICRDVDTFILTIRI